MEVQISHTCTVLSLQSECHSTNSPNRPTAQLLPIQAVYDLMLSLNGTEGNQDVVFIDGTTEQYRKLYNTTKFCLAPHGEWTEPLRRFPHRPIPVD